MKRVFEPTELDLGDAALLPNRVIEVQQKVQEMLSPNTNKFRRDELIEELSNQNAWALPGLINASMIFSNQLNDRKNRSEYAKILCSVARDNPTAINLLLKSGLFENPFPESRAVILEALQDWQPDDPKEIRRLIKRVEEDDAWVLDLYRLYLKSRTPSAYEEGIEVCERWFKVPKELAKDLFRELLINFPERSADTISRVFLSINEISKDARKDKYFANRLVKSVPSEIALEIIKDGSLLDISETVILETNRFSHKPVEELWKYSVAELKKAQKNDLESWLEKIANMILERGPRCNDLARQSIYRYWMQGLGEAGEIDFIIKHTYEQDENYRVCAATQLFFQKTKNKKAQQFLSNLQRDDYELYTQAESNFIDLTQHKGLDLKPIQEEKARKGPDLSEK